MEKLRVEELVKEQGAEGEKVGDGKDIVHLTVVCGNELGSTDSGEEVDRVVQNVEAGVVTEEVMGKQLIEKDLIRSIRDGRSTSVWGDAWIPGIYPFSIAKPANIITGELRVGDLLDDTGSWRDDVLNFLFTEDICRRIKSMSARDMRVSDRWTWLGGVHNDFWKRLWKLLVAPKYKNLVWRACVGILPTCVALNHKGVEMGLACTFCGCEDEETFHVLVDCPWLHGLWSGSRFDFGSRLWHNNITEWLAVEGVAWTQEQWGMCVIALYLLWEARNAIRFSNARLCIDQFWCRVAVVWEELQDLKSWKEWNDMFGRSLRCEKPTMGTVKLNTDAGTLAEGGGVLGGLLRDGNGVCVAAFTERVDMSHNATVLEAKAIRRGMEVAVGLGFERVVCESDAKVVLDFLMNMDAPLCQLRTTCQQIVDLKSSFSIIEFSWVPRCCNKASHFLVSFAKNYVQDNLWIDQLPSFLSDVLRFDLH
ncbi:reverse transcriptase [Senna tora]|uniref:Reverse transcriptase n=1 Tax=Senna tora TaxID=362788 RepID=A0A834TFN4_9FABA|nr:reverse transcriptase [Senna tora]